MKKWLTVALLSLLCIPFMGHRWPDSGGGGGRVGTEDVYWQRILWRELDGLAVGCGYFDTYITSGAPQLCTNSSIFPYIYHPMPDGDVTLGRVICQFGWTAAMVGTWDAADQITFRFMAIDNAAARTNVSDTFQIAGGAGACTATHCYVVSGAVPAGDHFEFTLNNTFSFSNESLQWEATAITDDNASADPSFTCIVEIQH